MKKRYFIALVSILIFIVFLIPKDTPPVVSASIRTANVTGNELTFTWVLENKSTEVITFDKDCTMKIKLNGEDLSYPYEKLRLNPQEEIKIPVTLNHIDPALNNTLSITAISDQGTNVTIQQTIYAD